MDLAVWFRDHLHGSAEGFCWAVEQVPAERAKMSPPGGLGEWPVVRHVFHMQYYERAAALPSMRQWLGGPKPSEDDYDEDAAWSTMQATADLHTLLDEFRQVRAEQIALLSQFGPAQWEEERDTAWTRPEPWGAITLRWVVTKTYQHTAEHTHDVLRLALFWDRVAAREREQTGAALPQTDGMPEEA